LVPGETDPNTRLSPGAPTGGDVDSSRVIDRAGLDALIAALRERG
jgi:hypothetical protein